MTAASDAAGVIRDAIDGKLFPAAAAEVGSSRDMLWRHAAGQMTFDPDAMAIDVSTPFDLASLTKVIAATTVSMQLVSTGQLAPDERIAQSFREWRGEDRVSVTVRDLLEHASGLPARLVDPPPAGRREFEHDICTMPLEYEPRSRSIYSDLGFILLAFLLADRGEAPLADQFRAAWPDDALTFRLSPEARARAAPTLPLDDDPRRGRVLRGEVHDAYAAALGGVAGHAGLFGTAPAVGAFARTVLRASRGDASPHSRPAAASLAARAHSAGIRCCRRPRAARACRRRRSATSGSPERRCGSIRRAIATMSS